MLSTKAPLASISCTVVPAGGAPPVSSETLPEMSQTRTDDQSWKLGMPVITEYVKVIDVTATVGRNQPDAPAVSVPLPVSVEVAGFHVGTSDCAMPLQTAGRRVVGVQ